MQLTGKVAVVTGGGGPGIGRAISRLLAFEGCRVAVSDIDQESGGETIKQIKEQSGEGIFVPANSGVE
jgi:NAD(P)-dependent dehydrogenase (short-subunit alcohol dehydrogenase family)